MEKCVFCQIAQKKIPAKIIWEDENFIAFLDANPQSKGHTLIIPKKHYRWVWEIKKFGQYFEKIKTVKEILEEKFKPLFIEMKVYGIDISHAHTHLIPHYQ